MKDININKLISEFLSERQRQTSNLLKETVNDLFFINFSHKNDLHVMS